MGFYGLPPISEVPGAGDAVYDVPGDDAGTLSLTRRSVPEAFDQVRTRSAPPEVECSPFYQVRMDFTLDLNEIGFGTIVELEFDPNYVQRNYVALVPIQQVRTVLDTTHPDSGEPASRVEVQLTQTPDGWAVDLELDYVEEPSVPWLTLDAIAR